MEEKGKETIAAFDTLLTTNRIQMMKVFLSYLAPEQQSGLAVYIKLSELQYAMQILRQSPGRPLFRERRTVLSLNSLMDGSLLQGDSSGIVELLDELLPFSGPSERSRILQLKNLLTSMGRMREMMDMMEMMQEMFPDGMGDGENAGFGDLFSGMEDPSALFQMFQMFQSSQSAGADSADTT